MQMPFAQLGNGGKGRLGRIADVEHPTVRELVRVGIAKLVPGDGLHVRLGEEQRANKGVGRLPTPFFRPFYPTILFAVPWRIPP